MNSLVFSRRSLLLPFLLVAFALLALAGASSNTSAAPDQPERLSQPQSVRIYLRTRAEANDWANRGVAVPEYIFPSDRPGFVGYIVTDLAPDQYATLSKDGATMQVLGAPESADWDPVCYQTYDQILADMQNIATQHPNIAQLTDIGDSWDKVHPAASTTPHDLWRLRLTSNVNPGPKPIFYLVAEHHAREIATPALAMAWVHKLISGYGTDANITALLDYKEIWIVPMQNPDGYNKVSDGIRAGFQEWRKNTDSDDGCATGSYGVDTNRNYDAVWDGPCPGGGCSSTLCSSETYRGPAPASEPEVQAMQTDLAAGPADLLISLHTYGPLVLYPYGNTTDDPPDVNDLDAMGWNFARINNNTPRSSTGQAPEVLYGTTGSTDDWTYRHLGIPSFTFELGGYNGFNMPCSILANVIPTYLPVLDYAASVTENSPRLSYDRAWGPVAQNVAVQATNNANQIRATAVLSSNYGTLVGAEYFVDALGANGTGTPLTGNFGGTHANVAATIDRTNLALGQHTLYLRGRNNQQRWGTIGAAFFTISPAGETPTITPTFTRTPTFTVTPTPSATPTVPTATPSATPCPMPFGDVAPGDYYYQAVAYLACHGAISGFADGTYRPLDGATRGQLAKIVVLADGLRAPVFGQQTFSDVPADNPFYPYIEIAANLNIVSGYADGTFRWYNPVTRAQLVKIVVNAALLPLISPREPTFNDVPPDDPFYSYVETAANANLISGYADGGFHPASAATRGQIAKIVYLALPTATEK